MNKKQMKYIFLLLFLTISLLSSYFFLNKFDTNIFTSLDRDYYEGGFSKAYAKYEKSLAPLVVVKLSGASFSRLKESADSLFLGKENGVLFTLATQEVFTPELGMFYNEHANKLLTPNQLETVKNKDFELLKKNALTKIYSPFTLGLSNLVNDPLLLLNDFYTSLIPDTNLKKNGKYFQTKEDQQVLIAFLKLVPTSEEKALKFFSMLKDSGRIVGDIHFSSASFYNIYARKQAMLESSLFSTLSICLILFLFWSYFKSFRQLFVCVLSLAFSISIALWVSSLFFGQLHILTVLLGTCTLGIIADYFIHYFIKEFDPQALNGAQAYKKIVKPLTLSFLTTLIGFLAFSLFPLKLLMQFSLFAGVALLCAFFLVRFSLPIFFIPYPSNKHKRSTFFNESVLSAILKRWKLVCIPLLLLIVGFLLSTPLTINSDIRTFSNSNEAMKLSEKSIRENLGGVGDLGVFIVSGRSQEELLRNEESLKARLKRKEVSFTALSDWVPSESKQTLSTKRFTELKTVIDNISLTLKLEPKLIFSKKTFTIKDFLEKVPNHIIEMQYLGVIDSLYYSVLKLDNSKAVSFDMSEFNSDNWVYMNKIKFLNRDVASFSRAIIYGIVVFSFIFLIIVGIKLSLVVALEILFAPIVAIFITSIFITLFSGPLNLFHLLGAILIFVLGIDYSFFYFFNRKDNLLTGLAVEFSTLTTLSSFAILSFSTTHAVHSFGLCVFVGILLCWVLSPLSFLRRNNEVATNV